MWKSTFLISACNVEHRVRQVSLRARATDNTKSQRHKTKIWKETGQNLDSSAFKIVPTPHPPITTLQFTDFDVTQHYNISFLTISHHWIFLEQLLMHALPGISENMDSDDYLSLGLRVLPL
jgi:hypothetical protein